MEVDCALATVIGCRVMVCDSIFRITIDRAWSKLTPRLTNS